MRCDACRRYGAWGGVFVSPAPAYADGYVAPDGNIYYGYKSDANYSKQRIKIEVHYYSSKEDADKDENRDPLGKFVRVKYVANLNSEDNSFDKWAFRPMWWYGVPSGLTNVHNINYSRFEKYTGNGKPVAPSSSQGPNKDSDNVTKHYRDSKDWKSISRFYVEDPSKLTSMNGLKTLLGIDNKGSKGYDSKGGTTADNWSDFYAASKGMQGMFIDWESAGKRFYEMTYVAELTPDAWKNRDEHPLRFAAGVYRFAGNWHIATGQIHRAPKIADSLKNVQYPSLTTVVNANDLNSNEKTSVETAIRKANENTKHFTALLDKIDVAKDGTATLTFHDNTTITMPGKLLVVEDKKDNVKFPPVYPAPMGVVNPQKLSEADQKAIIQGFKDANKDKDFLTKVSDKDSEVYKFDNNKQELTITYKDGSSLTIPYDQLVYQGATIADWAPYVVPDPIEVTDPSKLSEAEQKKVTDAFDTANADLDVYTKAKKNGNTPVTFDKDFKNAIITWADGSQSTIPSWQFLKEAAHAPVTPTPTPAKAKKEFKVTPTRIVDVNFNPFNMSQSDITSNSDTLNTSKNALAGYVKDAESGNAVSGVTVEYGVDSTGAGTVTFKASGYNDKTYPMSMFFKQKVAKQTPKEAEHSPQGKTQYKYKVKPIQYDGDAPNPLQQIQALKDFVKSNYGTDISNDTGASGGTYVLKKTDIPVPGTSGLQFFDKNSSDGAGVATIGLSTTTTDGSLTIQGYEKGDSNIKTLFTVPASELYVKKNSNIDHTLSDLKQQAKDLLTKRKGAPDKLTDKDLKKAGIADPANLNDSSKGIDKMNEKQLRDLIQKLTDAKHYDRKYNTPTVEVDDPDSLTADNFKAAVKAFLEANYDNGNTVNVTSTSDITLPTTLTPKKDTVYMEVGAYGVTKIKSVSKDGIVVVDGDGTTTFTVKPTYKKKGTKPTPTPGDDKQLQEMKKQAEELIDRNPKLTKEQKESFKQQIEKAKTKAEIQNILKEANNAASQSTVKSEDIKKKQKDEKDKHELDAAKDAAKKAIEALKNLSKEQKTEFENQLNGENVKTPADVQKIVDDAKLADELKGVKDGAQNAKFVFLDHGTGADGNTAETHAEDAALNSVLGTKPEEDSTLKTLAEKLKEGSKATAADIRDALNAAKRANDVNEQKAKDAATAKIEALGKALDDAVSKLSDADKTAVNEKVQAVKNAIETAKSSVTTATKPSDLLNAINSVNDSLTTANNAIKEKIDTEHNNNKKNNDHSSDPKELQKEKNDAKGEIDNIPGLTPEEQQKYKDEIDDSTHSGDPEAVVNRAKKHTKIKDALTKIDAFTHLNNAQKDAFKEILKYTDASDHKNDDGTTYDDIDNVLADVANTDNAMARLESLKIIADEFAKGEKYKGLKEGNEQKKAFDDASTAAGVVLDKVKGDAKNADQVNELYNDLLKAMRAINSDAQSAGLKTAALAAEIDSDKTFKPSETDPKTPGNSVYNTSSKAKKDAFDNALNEAQTVLNGAKTADISTADKEATEQNEIDAALDKLIKARLALDGVNTKQLQDEIDKDSNVKNSDRYTYSTTTEKKTAFDKALQDAKDLIDELTGTKKAAAGKEDVTTKTQAEKQNLVDDALAKLKAAEAALDGHAPTPTPTPSVDKSHLQQGINGSGDVKKSDDYNNAPSDKKQAYDHALDHANEVNKDPNATQDQVNQAAEDLKKAEHDLKPAPTPSVDKSGLQKEIGNEPNVKNSDEYNNAPSDK